MHLQLTTRSLWLIAKLSSEALWNLACSSLKRNLSQEKEYWWQTICHKRAKTTQLIPKVSVWLMGLRFWRSINLICFIRARKHSCVSQRRPNLLCNNMLSIQALFRSKIWSNGTWNRKSTRMSNKIARITSLISTTENWIKL